MAIVIDVLTETIIPADPIFNVPLSRQLEYTARSNGGTMYHRIRGGLDAVTDLNTLITSMAQELYDDAAANGTPIPDLVTKVFIERKRVEYFLKAWEVLRDEMSDTTTAPAGPTIINHVLAKLADDDQAADFFEAWAWRNGLTATITTQLTPAVVNALSAANQRILFQQIIDFIGAGLAVGLTGTSILQAYLEQAAS